MGGGILFANSSIRQIKLSNLSRYSKLMFGWWVSLTVFFSLIQTADSCCLTCSGNSNPGIRDLPAELGQLSNLWQLDIEDLNIANVPQEVRKEGTVQISLRTLSKEKDLFSLNS